MFEIDKKEFGRFLSELRKEHGMTQRELAEKLFVSDKAVSKWETGGSIPDVALLMPLAKLLDITVPELLECRRYEATEQIAPEKADAMMNTVLQMSDEERIQTERIRKRSQSWFMVCAILSLLGMLGTYYYFTQFCGYNPMEQSMPLMFPIFGLCFGACMCFGVKEKLPGYYDENKISAYSDGPFRMNIPGVYFNNSNWKHIIRVFRIWSNAALLTGPVVWFLACWFGSRTEGMLVFTISASVTGVVLLASMFIPVYIVAKKYE
ncbi:MAG: helix-turn-helix domain-containing protein [Lachnospiraceae bacterium]|nr:helix-turn-helix domain-containing protein [Lachnospiraceae bacterium]